jgi:hypothetical protein
MANPATQSVECLKMIDALTGVILAQTSYYAQGSDYVWLRAQTEM